MCWEEEEEEEGEENGGWKRGWKDWNLVSGTFWKEGATFKKEGERGWKNTCTSFFFSLSLSFFLLSSPSSTQKGKKEREEGKKRVKLQKRGWKPPVKKTVCKKLEKKGQTVCNVLLKSS